jgi:hypothetical protein
MDSFEIEVGCSGGGTAHTHRIVVKAGPGTYGASPPTNARMQYTCPVTGEAFIATFKPPTGAGRPFAIEKVT